MTWAWRLYPWTWYALLVLFLVFELVPLFAGKPQYTLSEYVWRLEDVNAKWTALRYFIAAFCLWLFLHMAFRWFT